MHLQQTQRISRIWFSKAITITNHQIYCLNKLSSKEIYSILIQSSDSKSSSQLYYKNVFQISNLDWKAIYMLPCIVTKDSRLRLFQYKLLKNVLYLKKILFSFGKADSPLCSFCKMIDQAPLHLFHNCTKTKLLWDQLKKIISNETLSFPSLTTKRVIFQSVFLLFKKLFISYQFFGSLFSQ